MLLWGRTGLLTSSGCRCCGFRSISSVCWAYFSDVLILLGFRKLWWVRGAANHQAVTMTLFWCQYGFGKCFGPFSWSNHWASHCIKSTFQHTSQSDQEMFRYCSIIVPNGSLLCRLRDDDTSEQQFSFWQPAHVAPTFRAFSLSSLLQMPDDCRMVDVELLGNFLCNCKRVSFDDPLSWSLTTSDGWPLRSSSSRSWTITVLYVH